MTNNNIIIIILCFISINHAAVLNSIQTFYFLKKTLSFLFHINFIIRITTFMIRTSIRLTLVNSLRGLGDIIQNRNLYQRRSKLLL